MRKINTLKILQILGDFVCSPDLYSEFFKRKTGFWIPVNLVFRFWILTFWQWYSDHLLFWIYAIIFLIIPPCLTMPRWTFCQPTYLFCCLLPYLFHCIPFAFYTVSFKYLIFSLVTNRANSCFTLGSQLTYFQPWYVHSLFLPWCRTNDDITNM